LISVSFCLKKLRPFADKELDRNTITVSAWHIGTPVAASNLQPHGESNQPAQSLCCAEKIHHFVNFPRMSLRHCPAFLQQLSVGCESWVCNLFVTPDASLALPKRWFVEKVLQTRVVVVVSTIYSLRLRSSAVIIKINKPESKPLEPVFKTVNRQCKMHPRDVQSDFAKRLTISSSTNR